MRRFGGVVLAFGAVLVLAGCSGRTTSATNITDASATLHATASCDSGQACTWYWEYWPAELARGGYGKETPVQGPVAGPTGDVNLSINITGLIPRTTYRWVFCASPNNGGTYVCAGPHGTFGSTTADPPPDYATLTTDPVRTLAERWGGTSWAIQPTPNPTSAQGGFLNGVSCSSATACTAVGSYNNSAGTQVTLAERWDGTSWTVQPTPNPTSATHSNLSGVSCTSATACTAVGNTTSAGIPVTLAERWDGTTWTIQPTPNPTSANESLLSGVSCSSATACTAVGFYNSSAGTQLTLAERWDGTAWTIQTTPNPNGAGPLKLSGVSCSSATACTAIGDYSNGSTLVTLAERWDGTAWTVQTTATPTGATYSSLSGVSCTSATACTAVGFYNSSAGRMTLAERWDGSAWTVQTTPNPNGALPTLSGVSCSSATACTTVGTYANSAGIQVTLAERWDGTTWTVQPTPNPPGQAGLSGVSCTSATACTATGNN